MGHRDWEDSKLQALAQDKAGQQYVAMQGD